MARGGRGGFSRACSNYILENLSPSAMLGFEEWAGWLQEQCWSMKKGDDPTTLRYDPKNPKAKALEKELLRELQKKTKKE